MAKEKNTNARTSGKGASASSGTKNKAGKASGSKRSGGTANAAFMKPLKPDAKLAKVVGDKAIPRTEMVKKMWDYIKANDLQDAKDGRKIHTDETLKPLFNKDEVSMFDIPRAISAHVE